VEIVQKRVLFVELVADLTSNVLLALDHMPKLCNLVVLLCSQRHRRWSTHMYVHKNLSLSCSLCLARTLGTVIHHQQHILCVETTRLVGLYGIPGEEHRK